MDSAAAGLELCQVVVVICARSKQRDWNYILRNRIKALSCLSVCCEMLLNTFVLTTSWRLTVWFVWGTVIQPRRRRGYGRHCKARNRYFIGNQLSTSIRTHADSDLRWVRANEIEKVMEEPRHHLNVLTLAYHQQPAHSWLAMTDWEKAVANTCWTNRSYLGIYWLLRLAVDWVFYNWTQSTFLGVIAGSTIYTLGTLLAEGNENRKRH